MFERVRHLLLIPLSLLLFPAPAPYSLFPLPLRTLRNATTPSVPTTTIRATHSSTGWRSVKGRTSAVAGVSARSAPSVLSDAFIAAASIGVKSYCGGPSDESPYRSV